MKEKGKLGLPEFQTQAVKGKSKGVQSKMLEKAAKRQAARQTIKQASIPKEFHEQVDIDFYAPEEEKDAQLSSIDEEENPQRQREILKSIKRRRMQQ